MVQFARALRCDPDWLIKTNTAVDVVSEEVVHAWQSVFLITLSFVSTDSIQTIDEKRIEGRVNSVTGSEVIFEVGGAQLRSVKAIYFNQTAPIAAGQLTDAVDALKGIGAIVESGVSYAEFARRVLDAKVGVARDLESRRPSTDSARIRAAMRSYEFASAVWNAKVLNRPLSEESARAIHIDISLQGCEAWKSLGRTRSVGRFQSPAAVRDLAEYYPDDFLQTFWACSKENLTQLTASR